jgi:hypothetical protein
MNRAALTMLALLGGCLEKTAPASSDPDADGIATPNDNCPSVYNPDQADANASGVGDACATWCDGRCAGLAVCDCEDFDSSKDLPDDWDLQRTGGGTAVVDGSDQLSFPNALRVRAPTTAAGEFATSELSFKKTVQASGVRIVLDFDWKFFGYAENLDRLHSFQYSSVAIAELPDMGGRVAFYNRHDPTMAIDQWFVGRTTAPGECALPGAPPQSAWFHVGLDVTFSTTAGKIVVTWGDQQVTCFDGEPNTRPFDAQHPRKADVGVLLLAACKGGCCGSSTCPVPSTQVGMVIDNVLTRVLE